MNRRTALKTLAILPFTATAAQAEPQRIGLTSSGRGLLDQKEDLPLDPWHNQLMSLKDEWRHHASVNMPHTTLKAQFEAVYVGMLQCHFALQKNHNIKATWAVIPTNIGRIIVERCGLADPLQVYTPTKIHYLGTLSKRWRLYIDPLWPQNTVMIGDKQNVGTINFKEL